MARYKFEFEATTDPRKGIPYVARLVVRDGKLEREFYNLKRVWEEEYNCMGRVFCGGWRCDRDEGGCVVEERLQVLVSCVWREVVFADEDK